MFENKKKPNAKAKLNDIYDSKWELEYHQYLQTQGKTALCHVIKFQLANGCWYMPDFLVVGDCGKLELHEVKGHWREAAKVRFKVARDKFPWFVWRVVRKEKGSWIEEEV